MNNTGANMNKTAIQIKMIALWTVILLFTACQDDMPFRNADRIQEGIPTIVKLGFLELKVHIKSV